MSKVKFRVAVKFGDGYLSHSRKGRKEKCNDGNRTAHNVALDTLLKITQLD